MIQILGLVLLCAALIVVTYYSPKIGFGLLGGLAVLVVVLYYVNTDDASNPGFEVPPELVKLENATASKSYGDSWDYKGRITNDSDKPLYDIQVEVSMHDCEEEAQANIDECLLIGQLVDYVSVKVPPRQARDFKDNIAFKDAVPKGFVHWEFKLVGVRVTD